MFKKILKVGGILLVIYIALSSVKVNSNNIYNVEDGNNIVVSLGAGNFRVDGGTHEGTVKATLNHRLLARPIVKLQDKQLGILMKSGNGALEVPTDINLNKILVVGGAGDFGFNLKDIKVSELNASLGASNVVLIVPKDVDSKINLKIGAGSLLIRVPTNGKLEGVKIMSDNLSNMELDGMEKIEGGIQTEDFEKAVVKSVINLAGSGTLQLNVSAAD